MGNGSTKSDIHIEAEGNMAPVVTTTHPITGVPMTLLDPAYRVVQHRPNSLVLEAPESFVDVVKILGAEEGASDIVQLRSDGQFVYRDKLGPEAKTIATYKLEKHPTAEVLGLASNGFSFTQRGLLRWCDQWKDTLIPDDDNPAAVLEELANFKATSVKQAAVSHGEGRASISVEADDFAEGTDFPRRWFGVSPLYRDHEALRTELRMDVKLPEADTSTGNAKGALIFIFKLWSPAACEIEDQGIRNALAVMKERLPDFTIIRGMVTPAAHEEPAYDTTSRDRRY